MAQSLSHRLPALLVAIFAACTLAAAPAFATEGPPAPPPADPLPDPMTFEPFADLGAGAEVVAGAELGAEASAPVALTKPKRAVRRARVVPRRIRSGRRGTLKVSLSTPTKLRIVLSRKGGKRIRTFTVKAKGRSVSLRLPARTKGHDLRPGTYRVSIVAIDAEGKAAKAVRRNLVVRRAAKRK
jgi:hypothetical protein